MSSPLQWRPTSLEGKVELFHPCQLVMGNYSISAESYSPHFFWAVEEENVDGYEAVRFESEGWPLLNVWLSSELPYPVRIRWDQSVLGGHLLTVSLKEFHRGTGPIGRSLPAAEYPALPPVSMASRQVYGPTEDGITPDFPLSQAFSHARDDPEWSNLRVFMEAHPTAYVVWADYRESETDLRIEPVTSQDEYRSQSWDIVVSDGGAELSFEIQRTARFAGALQGAPPSASGLLVAYDYGEGYDLSLFDYEFPPVSNAPATLPTVASLFERWSYYADPTFAAEPPNLWGFRINCSDACNRTTTYVHAGHTSSRCGNPSFPQGAPTDAECHYAESRVGMDETGRVGAVSERRGGFPFGPDSMTTAL